MGFHCRFTIFFYQLEIFSNQRNTFSIQINNESQYWIIQNEEIVMLNKSSMMIKISLKIFQSVIRFLILQIKYAPTKRARGTKRQPE